MRPLPLLVLVPLLFFTISCGQSQEAARPFLVGWYTSAALSPERLGPYAREGVNLVLPYFSGEGRTATWVRAAEKERVPLLLQPDWRWVAHGKLRRLANFVRRYRDSAALYGWYLYDEPEVNNLPPARLVAAYRLIKSLDSHPVAVVFGTEQCRFGLGGLDRGYLAAFDLLMYDYYPFYTTIPALRSWKAAGTADNECAQSAREHHKQGPILVLQAFGQGWRDGPFQWRDPSLGETRCLFALAQQSGAQGVLFWSDEHADAAVAHNTNGVIAAWHDGAAPSARTACGGQPVPGLARPGIR
jgi:hypothetical protein